MEEQVRCLCEKASFKFNSGEDIPPEMCNLINSSQCFVLASLVGIIMPDPVSFFGGPIAGLLMYNSDIKTKVIRYIANSFAHRFKTVTDDGEYILRLEINIGFEQWLPLFVFKKDNITSENGILIIKQSSSDELFGPMCSTAEEIVRSSIINNISKSLDHILSHDKHTDEINITHTFSFENETMLAHSISISKQDTILNKITRTYSSSE